MCESLRSDSEGDGVAHAEGKGNHLARRDGYRGSGSRIAGIFRVFHKAVADTRIKREALPEWEEKAHAKTPPGLTPEF